MDGVFTCQPEGFDALRAPNRVVNRLCRSLHGTFYSLFCIPNCIKRSRETYVIDGQHFEMDFRLAHPWFGQLFRYSGKFAAMVDQ